MYMCWRNILTYNVINTIMLANTSILSPSSFFVVGTVKNWTLSNFGVYNTALLAIITMLCVRSPKLVYICFLQVCTLKQHLPNSPAPQSLVTTILLSWFYKFGFFFSFGHAVQLVRSYFFNQGLNLGPQQWKSGIQTTNVPGSSLRFSI